jgi:glycosyltransferase involved in cell wall biosynthesis
MRVFHISADFPDPLVPAKTRAVENLLALVPEHEHRVWSLNRVDFRRGVSAMSFGDGHRAVAYGAPPRGIGLAGRLAGVAEFILEDIARLGSPPDVVHAHKVSVEGLVGASVARQLGCPLIISSQGDSDLKILMARPDLRRRWQAIWHRAAVAMPFAPWTKTRLEALLGMRTAPTYLLPCPQSHVRLYQPKLSAEPLVRTALHLASHRRKNLSGLMRAVALAAKDLPDLRLEIIGGGDPEAFARLSEEAASIDLARIHLIGPRTHGEVSTLFNSATCMALPSHRESFGMVFVEALLAGCPVLGPAGWAIDGYLPDGPDEIVGLFVPAQDEAAVAEALTRLIREEAAFKRRLAALQEKGGLALFRNESIARTYARALADAVSASRPSH